MKIPTKEQGKKFYEMRRAGLNNAQIGARYGLQSHTVGARVSEYRIKNNLPNFDSKGNSFTQAALEDEKIRKNNMKQAFRRADGILQCPTKTCEGFGFNEIFFNMERK